jgi:hypothetical protein
VEVWYRNTFGKILSKFLDLIFFFVPKLNGELHILYKTGELEWLLGDMYIVMATVLQPVIAPAYELGSSVVFSRPWNIHYSLRVYAAC